MRRVVATAGLTALLLAGAPVAWATFLNSGSAGASFSTDSLAAPTGLSATPQCGLLQYEIHLSWTATTSSWADGYEVTQATSSNGPFSVVPLPLGGDPLATTRVVGSLEASTTYWFRVAATRGSWRSAPVSANATTSAVCVV